MFPNVRRVSIRQAPGIPGSTVYRVKVKQSGDPYLATQPGGASPECAETIEDAIADAIIPGNPGMPF